MLITIPFWTSFLVRIYAWIGILKDNGLLNDVFVHLGLIDHPLRITRDPVTGEPAPYILIRSNLEALIDRKSFYRLVELGCHAAHDGHSWFGLWSSGQFFPVIPSSELP